jgi:putative heme iron utilization protein
MNDNSSAEELLQAISQLWRNSFHCQLSTHSVKFEGYPFGSVLPICRDSQGRPLLMISHLAQHTRNLDADPRCSFTLVDSNHADVQQWTRLTCLAEAEPTSSSTALERYYRYYPEGRQYHKELNFSLYRLKPIQFYLIAGFGSARWFDVSRVLDEPHFPTAEELEILYQLNAREHNLLGRFLTSRQLDHPEAKIHAVGADPNGLDLRLGDSLTRCPFDSPIAEAGNLVEQLETAAMTG